MISKDGKGVLNDWDLSKHEKDIRVLRDHELTVSFQRRPDLRHCIDRSAQGTWQFLACLHLMRPGKLHTIQDDMESFVYVILWLGGLLYLKHNKEIDLSIIMGDVFDYSAQQHGGTDCGQLWQTCDGNGKNIYRPGLCVHQ